MTEYNLALQPRQGSGRSNKGGAGSIETTDAITNIVWQTRFAPPTAHENALGDALERLFRDGVDELAAIVAGLNEAGVHGPDGRDWTEESFRAEMARLGR